MRLAGVEPSNVGEYTPITIVETVSQRSQALVANDIGYWKRHVYFTSGVEDQSHVLEAGIKCEADTLPSVAEIP
jgi:hypothetical protein